MSIVIQAAAEQDWPAIWQIIAPVFRSGTTYAFATDISETAAHSAWLNTPVRTYVAKQSDAVVGTYYIKTNQAGPGSHVCNCGYIVDENARGQGIASLMCEHSQQQAIELGFRAMQYNLVVSTNDGAVRLWKKHGFEIVGILPAAFQHAELGFVDAYVMYKQLV